MGAASRRGAAAGGRSLGGLIRSWLALAPLQHSPSPLENPGCNHAARKRRGEGRRSGATNPPLPAPHLQPVWVLCPGGCLGRAVYGAARAAASTSFGKREGDIMGRMIVVGACLLVLASGAAMLAQPGTRVAGPAEPAPAVLGPPLEVGKSYTFNWSQGPLQGTVVEAPRGNWVKMKRQITSDREEVCWGNLGNVLYVREAQRDK